MPTKVCIVKAMVFPVTDVRVRPQRKLSPERLMLSNWGAGEDSCESLGLQGDQILKEINPECSLEGLMLKLKLHYFST